MNMKILLGDVDKIIKISRKYEFIKIQNVRRMQKFRFENQWWFMWEFSFNEIKEDVTANRNVKWVDDYPGDIMVAVPKFGIR